MTRNYFYKVDDPNQLEMIKFCPYCGSDDMYVYSGDFHSYTVCFDCDDELEFMAVMKELEE